MLRNGDTASLQRKKSCVDTCDIIFNMLSQKNLMVYPGQGGNVLYGKESNDVDEDVV